MLTSIQIAKELNGLIRYLVGIKAKTALEIGAGECGTSLWLWSAMGEDSDVVAVDLPESSGGTSAANEAEAKGRMGDSFTLVRGDSLAPETVKAVINALRGRTVDLLLIDSEHTEARMLGEFNAYRPLLSERGIVAFHDICFDDLWPAWCKVRSNFPPRRTLELIESPVQRACGIGVILGGA